MKIIRTQFGGKESHGSLTHLNKVFDVDFPADPANQNMNNKPNSDIKNVFTKFAKKVSVRSVILLDR